MIKYYKITGDENDGDSCSSELKASDIQKGLKNIHPLFSEKTNEEIVLALVEALKENSKRSHNWARFEYDDECEALPLITLWVLKLFGVDISTDEFQESVNQEELEYESVEEQLYYFFSYNILPSNEISIHTINNIVSYNISDKKTLF